jgi:hypothetical protein
MVHFSYGGRIDPDLKKTILKVIPQTRLKPGEKTEQGGK